MMGRIDQQTFYFLMREAGLGSQNQLAAEIGLDGPKLSNILSGKRAISLAEAARLAIRLKTDLETVAIVLGCLPDRV